MELYEQLKTYLIPVILTGICITFLTNFYLGCISEVLFIFFIIPIVEGEPNEAEILSLLGRT
jgi:hypothetical protein